MLEVPSPTFRHFKDLHIVFAQMLPTGVIKLGQVKHLDFLSRISNSNLGLILVEIKFLLKCKY